MGTKPATIRDYRLSDPIPDVFGHETAAQYEVRVDKHRAALAPEKPRHLEGMKFVKGGYVADHDGK